MTESKKFLAIIILLLTALALNAQDKKENTLDAKLKEIKGKVQKIVITSDGKQTVLEGDDAAKLFEKFKGTSQPDKKLIWVSEDGDSTKLSGKGMKFFMKKDGDEKNVKVEKVDGEMIVTVESEDGDESEVTVYTGDDAEKFLQDKKKDGKVNVIMHKNTGKKKASWVTLESESEKSDGKKEIQKKITVDKSGGELNVKVETTENGETKVEEFKGEEAEKFLKENEKGGVFHIFSEDGDGKHVTVKSSDDDSTGCCKKFEIKLDKNDCKDKESKVIIIKKKDKKSEDK